MQKLLRKRRMMERREREVRVTGEEGGKEEETIGEEGSEEGDEQEDDEGNEREVDGDTVVAGEGRESGEEVEGEVIAGDEGVDVDEKAEGDREVGRDEEKENVEGEIPEEMNAIENEEEIVDEDDGKTVETGEAVDMNVDEPEREGLKEIVVLEDRPDDEETQVDERMTRRNTRRSRQVDESMAAIRARKLQFGTSEGEEGTGEGNLEAQETPGQEDEVSADAAEKRYAAGRKRKGKQETKPQKKKAQAGFLNPSD